MEETILEIVKYIIPALVVALTAYLMMKSFIDKEISRKKVDLKITNSKLITPVRLQAYERIVLFLERISPETLFVRLYKPGINTEQLHKIILQTVRNEYEHNLSQQVYVSEELWESVKTAKESVLRLINTAASSQKARENAQQFSKMVIEAYNTVDTKPTESAIELAKNEIAEQLL